MKHAKLKKLRKYFIPFFSTKSDFVFQNLQEVRTHYYFIKK